MNGNAQIKVIPKSSKNEIIELDSGLLKVKLTAAPVGGKANKKLIELLAKKWKIPKSKIQIIKGKKSTRKTISIN